MLKRIKRIQNIGRFADCNSAGCEFKDTTIIFGYNTQGKSTLTAILRSLQTGNNDILIGRKTFGTTSAKKVEIDFEENSVNQNYIFQNKAWNKSNPNIIIFDSKFISQNVFEGESITYNQQKNMNSIIIGKFGNDLNNEISILQEKCNDFEYKKRNHTIEFSRFFPEVSQEKFINMKKDSNIEKKILDKEKEIKFEKEKEEIKLIIKNHIDSLDSIDFSIKNTLNKSMNIKQQEIESHIMTHFSNKENAQSFLNEGLDFMKDKSKDGTKRTCIFCGQELGQKAEKLIKIYSAFFKGGYEQLQGEINKAIDYFKQINIRALITKIESDLKVKGLDVGLTDQKILEISKFKSKFEEQLDKKRDLNYSIDFTCFDSIQNSIETLTSELKKIEKQRLNVSSTKTISDLEKEKEMLQIIKKRFTLSWIKYCQDINDIEVNVKEARRVRDEKRKELENYSTSVFDSHKKIINDYCEIMGSDFKIDDFKPLKKIVGQDERIFAIKFFDSHKIIINNNSDAMPNFKNTLSESDKRLLAFAFFLATLANDKELDKKIIIFDDPMSSFDIERRRKSIQLITDISSNYKKSDGTDVIVKPRQKIILTHEDRFAKELFSLIPNSKTFKIEEYNDSENMRSRLAHADFSKDFPDDEIIDKIQKLKQILDSRNFEYSFETDCRIILENIFKRKYNFDLNDLISSRKSVRSFISKLKELKINDYDQDKKFNLFIRLCNDLNIELHDNGSKKADGDKESILKDFFISLKII